MKSKTSKTLLAAAVAITVGFGFPASVLALPGGGGDVASFTASSECQGNQTSFVSTSASGSNTIVEWNWDFNNDGDFSDASGANVSAILPGFGTLTVGHQIVTDANDTTEVYQSVTVYPNATANFTASSECAGNSTSLMSTSSVGTGSIVSSNWDIDNDGSFDDYSGTNIMHNFGAAGTYTVGLEVVTDNGCVTEIYNSVTVNPNPTVDFTFTNVCIGDSTDFMASGNVSTGSISSYNWDLNEDGMFDDASGMSISHLFTSPGTYNVAVQVTTNNGCQASASHVVTVSPLPVILFDAENVCAGQEVAFINNSINQVGTMSYDWDFGDGGSSNLSDPKHVYASSGSYTVELTGTNSYGCTSTGTLEVTIHPSPSAGFTATDVCFNGTTEFTNTTSGNGSVIGAYFWDFGDNEGTSVINPNHTYAAPGTYTVQLIVTSIQGCMDTATEFANVWELPDPLIYSSTSVFGFCEEDSINLFVDLENDETAFWSTGEFGSSITITEGGYYHALVEDSHGCQGGHTVTVDLWPLPVLSISNDTTISLGYDVPLWVTGAESYEWSPSTYLDDPFSSNPTSTPNETIIYTVTGTSTFGCQSTTSVTITVEPDYTFEPSNIITPNDNGQNDKWYVKNLELYDDCDIVIVNRWGNEVFSSRGYSTPWDGTYEGEPLPEATYYYIVKCDGTDKIYKGPITLLRLNE